MAIATAPARPTAIASDTHPRRARRRSTFRAQMRRVRRQRRGNDPDPGPHDRLRVRGSGTPVPHNREHGGVQRDCHGGSKRQSVDTKGVVEHPVDRDRRNRGECADDDRRPHLLPGVEASRQDLLMPHIGTPMAKKTTVPATAVVSAASNDPRS